MTNWIKRYLWFRRVRRKLFDLERKELVRIASFKGFKVRFFFTPLGARMAKQIQQEKTE